MGSDVTGNVNVIGAEGKQGTVSKTEDVMGLLLVDQLFLVLESAPTNLLGWYLFCKL